VNRTYRGRLTPEDRSRSIYQYVPVEVPRFARAVSVRLEYDRRAATLDLGVFDPEGFRGYSGGARDSFVIGREDATPGYLPGELPAGEWRVLLGLHEVPGTGVNYALEVHFGSATPLPLPPLPKLPERPPVRELPAEAGRRWLAGDLHCHSVHSDGAHTLDELAAMARGRGLDFLAVTDHNTTSHHPHLAAAGARAGVLLVAGQEVTAAGGHANCFGEVGWIDFRNPPDDWLRAAEARGGLFSINHPLTGDPPWTRPMKGNSPLLEVWHSTWDRRSQEPLELWKRWDGIGVAGSDFHAAGSGVLPGAPTTWLEAEDEDVLEALAAGRVAMSAAPDGPVVIRHEGAVLALDAAGTRLVEPSGEVRPVSDDRLRVDPAAGSPYSLWDAEGRILALCA
jgi:hypothetical protein